MGDEAKLSHGRIFRFWSPLALTWLMMAAEGPFLAAVVARLADPKPNLAASGVAFSFALLVEAPIIMLMAASTAMAGNRAAYLKLRAFTWWLNGGITAVMALLLATPAMGLIARDLIGLPEEVARLTLGALVLLLPWPAAIGFRRFYQGILVRADQTRKVAYGTVVRLISMGGTALCLYHCWRDLPGAYVGAAALSTGVIMEAIASRLMAASLVRRLVSGGTVGAPARADMSLREIASFYYPLAITSVVALAIHPVVSFFLGHSRLALESLAVMPVVSSLSFVFRSLGLSYQEAVIALLGARNERYPELRSFGVLMGVGASAALALIAFTPLAGIWFRGVSGLGPGLAELAVVPAMLLVPLPLLTAVLSLQRGVMVKVGRTGPVSWSTVAEVGTAAVVLWLTVHELDLVGAAAAALALVVGRLAGNGYLIKPCGKALRSAPIG